MPISSGNSKIHEFFCWKSQMFHLAWPVKLMFTEIFGRHRRSEIVDLKRCYSAGSRRQHRCCSLAITVAYSLGMPKYSPSKKVPLFGGGSVSSANTWFLGPQLGHRKQHVHSFLWGTCSWGTIKHRPRYPLQTPSKLNNWRRLIRSENSTSPGI